MAGGEDQAQKFIADVVVHGRFDFLDTSIAFILQAPSNPGVLALKHLVAAQSVNGPALGRRHQPAAGLSGTPVIGHSDRAVTRASCASSSVRPRSHTNRTKPA